MLDRGLLLSGGAVLVVLAFFGRGRRPGEPALSEVALWPALVGLAAGRLVAMALDDPASLRTGRNLFLVRGGVELWPGVAAAALTALAHLRRHRRPVGPTIGLLVPSAVAAWATYDLACLVRDGCPGPPSSFGLRPPGLTTTQVPIGVLVGLVGLGAAVALRAMSARRSATWVILGGLLTVSALRSIESLWLPTLDGRITRQTAQTLAVLAGTVTTAVLVAAGRRVTRGRGIRGRFTVPRRNPSPVPASHPPSGSTGAAPRGLRPPSDNGRIRGEP